MKLTIVTPLAAALAVTACSTVEVADTGESEPRRKLGAPSARW